jgi:hypothetical protein
MASRQAAPTVVRKAWASFGEEALWVRVIGISSSELEIRPA